MSSNRSWLSHYDPWIPHSLTYPERPLWEIIDAACAEVPDRPATLFLGATLTYREITRQSDWFAAALVRLGFTAGDRAAIMLPNCPQYLVAAFAVLRAGGIVVNLNPAYTAAEIQVLVADARPRVVVTLDTLAGLVQSLEPGSIEHIVVTSLAEYSSDGEAPPRTAGALSLADLVQGVGRPPITGAEVDADAVAVLQYTGGTTGTPKGAMLTHRNLFANVVQTDVFTHRTRTRGIERYMMVLPYYHAFGFTVGMLKGTWIGALQILVPRYHPEVVLDLVRQHAPSYFPGVPTIWASLIAHPRAPDSGLDRVALCTTGGSPCPRDLAERWEQRFGRPLFEGFGLSEASPVTHSTPQLGRRRPGSIGLPMPDTDIKIVDVETGEHLLDAGQAGELCISGPQVMPGYWHQPDETARVLQADAEGRVWLHTGDIAVLDADGYTTIVERKKDMLIVDGYNVYPSEVEAALRSQPDVAMAAVVGVPDPYHGETVRAFVVLEADAHLSDADLRAYCRERLAPHKVPARIEFRASLPMTALGKILYRVLRDEAGG
jgi:long-chain acyl-CoA synthetase